MAAPRSLRLLFAVLGLVLLFAEAAAAQGILHRIISPNAEADGGFGSSASGVGDVDGDGVPDLLIGAFKEEPDASPTWAGRAYVFSGATGALIHELTSPNEAEFGEFGQSVAGVGDTDGDGVPDLFVGAPFESPGASPPDAGGAYVFSGSSGALLYELASPNEETGGHFGGSVSEVGDVDGDGRADLLVGAWGESRVYVFSGATGALLFDLVSPSGEEDGAFGSSVSEVEDVDADGVGDILVGARGEDPGASPEEAGRAYVFSGASGVLIHTLASPNEEEDGFFGWSVSGVGDVDGDGRSDLLVGASWEDPGPGSINAGRAYVFSGATGILLYELVSPNEGSNGYFGGVVSGVPDVDGDGAADLLVSADHEGDDPMWFGRVYVFSGATGALLRTLESPLKEGNGYFGSGVAGLEDVDGDGRGDFIIGALGESPSLSLSKAGRAYVFRGGFAAPLFAAAPLDPPVVIPPGGGSFAFTATLTIQSAFAETWEVWGEGTGPGGGAPLFALDPVTVTLEAGQDTTLTLVQEVLATVPEGEYTYTVYVGRNMIPAGEGVSFPVTKAEGTAVEAGAPTAFVLDAPRPNPSPGLTTLTFALPAPSPVRLAVYDVLGREVVRLVDGAQGAGRHEVAFDGAHLPSGAYVVRLEATGVALTRLLVVLR